MFRRSAAPILILCFLALGSGALQYVHELNHAREDAAVDAVTKASGQPVEQHEHDDSNCPVHAQLHMPIWVIGWTPLLILLGLITAFLTLLHRVFISGRPALRLGCRGPPLVIPIS